MADAQIKFSRDYFPEPYSPRKEQETFLEFLDSTRGNGKKYKIAMLPTALGKSFLAKTIIERNAHNGTRTAITTPQNILIDQYIRDFPTLPNLKGQGNYPCLMFGDGTASGNEGSFSYFEAVESTLCLGDKCPQVSRCPYISAKLRVALSPYALFNPLSFTYSRLKYDSIIIDEAHGLCDMLLGTYEIKIWQRDVNWNAALAMNVVKLLEKIQERVYVLTAFLKKTIQAIPVGEPPTLKKRREISKLNKEITTLSHVHEDFLNEHENLVVEYVTQKYRGVDEKCFLIRAAKLPKKVSKAFFSGANEIILMSGTLMPHTLEDLRIDPEDCDFFEAPSPIPPTSRRFYSTNRVNNSYAHRETVIPILAKHIREIANTYPDERGFVLATYEQAEKLKPLLNDDPRFLFHDRENKKDSFKAFLESKSKNCIGVFSGMSEGADLKDDLARFCILTKMMFPYLGDGVVKRRMSNNPEWYGEHTLMQTIQGAGRIVRNEKDFGSLFILDSNFLRVYASAKRVCPNYFKEAVTNYAQTTSFDEILSKAKQEYEQWRFSRNT
jgi:Rad3-related DNA helicase